MYHSRETVDMHCVYSSHSCTLLMPMLRKRFVHSAVAWLAAHFDFNCKILVVFFVYVRTTARAIPNPQIRCVASWFVRALLRFFCADYRRPKTNRRTRKTKHVKKTKKMLVLMDY